MVRRSLRRGVSSPRQYDEEIAQEQENPKSSLKSVEKSMESGKQNTDRLIADMAQGFVQAQASIADKSTNLTNQEILSLLQKVSDQLGQMQQSAQAEMSNSKSQNTLEQNQKEKAQYSKIGQENINGNQQPQNETKQQPQSMLSQELQNVFSQILQSEGKDNSNQPSNAQGADSQANSQKKDKSATMAVQTAAQVLSQAQCELSNELEASLKKLKQVISESEKIANRISNLLGEESTKNS